MSYSAYKVEGIENFPESYKPYLVELQKKHPQWQFTAIYTGLNWYDVINSENVFGMNLVPKSYSDNWKNTTPGLYNIEIDAGWVDSSRRALEYTLDPRNFLNDVRIFQFEGLSYDERTNNIDGIEKILYGTEFYNRIVQYLDSYGNIITMQSKYSDLILNAARTSRVSSYHLASRIKQEVGPFLSHSSISGNVSGYRGLYNFYNIGATSSAETMGAIKNGLQYARDGKGASQAVRDKYLIPWNTKERAITGGAIFIGSSYINRGQDCIYLQKFHVVDNSSNNLFWHQYMTNILAPYNEARSIYNGYINTGILNSSMSFVIPIFNDMPVIPVQSPSISDNDFISDNTRVYANVNTTLNVRTGPSTSYEVLTAISRNETVTRIGKGNQSGELWDRVLLQNGIVGYVYQSYLKEIPNINISNARLNIQNNIITGWNYRNMNVPNIKNQFINYLNIANNVEIFNNKGTLLSDGNLVGTGATIREYDINGNIYNEYKVVLYGDVNGDGKIDSIDLLVLQRHILEIEELKGYALVSGNVSKNGNNPSSITNTLAKLTRVFF